MRILVVGATFDGCCYAHYFRQMGYHVDIVDKDYYADDPNMSTQESDIELKSFVSSSSFYSENRVTKIDDELNDLLYDFDIEDDPSSSDRYNRIYAYIDSSDSTIKRVFDAFPSRQIPGDIILPNRNLRKEFVSRIDSKTNDYDYELSVLKDMYRADYIELYIRMLRSFDIINANVDSVNNDATVLFSDGVMTKDYDSIIIATSAQVANKICQFSSSICEPKNWRKLLFPHEVISKEFYKKCFMSDTIFFTLENSNIIKIYSNGDFWVCVYKEPEAQDEAIDLYNDLCGITSKEYIDLALTNKDVNKKENYAKINSFFLQRCFIDGLPSPVQCNPITHNEQINQGKVYRIPFANGIRQTISNTVKVADKFCESF